MRHTRAAYPLTLLYDGACPICRIEMVERAYAAFARNRYAVSALLAPVLARLEASRAARRAAGACTNGVCETNQGRNPS